MIFLYGIMKYIFYVKYGHLTLQFLGGKLKKLIHIQDETKLSCISLYSPENEDNKSESDTMK